MRILENIYHYLSFLFHGVYFLLENKFTAVLYNHITEMRPPFIKFSDMSINIKLPYFIYNTYYIMLLSSLIYINFKFFKIIRNIKEDICKSFVNFNFIYSVKANYILYSTVIASLLVFIVNIDIVLNYIKTEGIIKGILSLAVFCFFIFLLITLFILAYFLIIDFIFFAFILYIPFFKLFRISKKHFEILREDISKIKQKIY